MTMLRSRLLFPVAAYWSAYYSGDATHFFCSPPGVYVKAGYATRRQAPS